MRDFRKRRPQGSRGMLLVPSERLRRVDREPGYRANRERQSPKPGPLCL
jgi:hypothetical protein